MGISEACPHALQRFGDAFLRTYPYLRRYTDTEDLSDQRVLEIGLGYGTLGELIASRTPRYHGVDIAGSPLAMMRYRLSGLDRADEGRLLQASVLALPYRDASFDYVYSIGCLHHTGNLPQAVSEVHRGLASGGKSIVMLYNRYSFRRLVHIPLLALRQSLARGPGPRSLADRIRSLYDVNREGQAAPHTDFVSRRQVRPLFQQFSGIRIENQNFDVIRRKHFLNNVARVLGLDLYVVAVK